MSDSVKKWLVGLLSVTISSAAGGVSVVVVDPVQFNFHSGFGHLCSVCGILALIHAALYLAKSPLPGVNMDAGGKPQ